MPCSRRLHVKKIDTLPEIEMETSIQIEVLEFEIKGLKSRIRQTVKGLQQDLAHIEQDLGYDRIPGNRLNAFQIFSLAVDLASARAKAEALNQLTKAST